MFSLFIGRYSPLHEGHIKLLRKVLDDEEKKICIGVRDTPIAPENPFSVEERFVMLREEFGKEIEQGNVVLLEMPDIGEVCYGRNVGWGIRRVRLSDQIEEISASKIRDKARKTIWLTGNVASGKTSLAYLLKDRLNGVILDGDEMRASISLGAGFSKEDREEHNLRVARLAKILHAQGHQVIVSVIAPFASTRAKIDDLIDVYWVHVKSKDQGVDRPYEVPENPLLTIDPENEEIQDSIERISCALKEKMVE